jgi:uncharacterized membrane protein YccC
MVMDAGRDNAGYDSSEWKAATHDDIGPSGSQSRDRPAAKLPDPQKLAQDWITLWQSELSAMAADPELRESWQTIMALWAGTLAAVVRGLPRAPAARDRPARPAGAADAARTEAATAASDARDAEIERLARHVATLERRLADIERGNPPVHPKRRPGRKPRN